MFQTPTLFHTTLKPLKSSVSIHTQFADYWVEGSLVYIIVKKAGFTASEIECQLKKFKKILNGRRYCAVLDISILSMMSPEVYFTVLNKLSDVFKAVACINFRSSGIFYPGPQQLLSHCDTLREFPNEYEALFWVNQFLLN